MLIKVLIVDDEYLQRQLVIKAIDWFSMGMAVAGEAEDGRQAVQIAQVLKPDIIIMDINIPHLNGIEASKYIKSILPDSHILILTAYGEFEYAKDALMLGASGFILKPLDPDELTKELDRLRSVILNKQALQESFDILQKEQFRVAKENFILEQLAGISHTEDNVEFNLTKYQIQKNVDFCVMNLRLIGNEVADLKCEIEEIISEQFSKIEMINVENDMIAILFCETYSKDYYTNTFQFRVQALVENMNQISQIGFLCFGGLSTVHQNFLELHIAYREARSALMHAINEKCTIVPFQPEDIVDFMSSISYRPDQIMYYLRNKNHKIVIEQLHQCFDQIYKRGAAMQNLGFYIAVNLLIAFSIYFQESGIDISNQLAEEKEIIEKLGISGCIREIERELERFLLEGIRLLEYRLIPSTKRKVEDARRFIEINYFRSDLGLNMIAEIVGVNPSYLSNVFKNEMGCSLSRYITKIRLENAFKQLNQEPSISVTKLARDAGYVDVYYFSKCFKSYFGFTPSKWIEERGHISPSLDS